MGNEHHGTRHEGERFEIRFPAQDHAVHGHGGDRIFPGWNEEIGYSRSAQECAVHISQSQRRERLQAECDNNREGGNTWLAA